MGGKTFQMDMLLSKMLQWAKLDRRTYYLQPKLLFQHLLQLLHHRLVVDVIQIIIKIALLVAQDNCVALWGDCTGKTCCGPAECFSAGNSASCIPPTDVTPTPTFAPTKTCRAKGEPCQSKKDCCKKKCKKGKCKK